MGGGQRGQLAPRLQSFMTWVPGSEDRLGSIDPDFPWSPWKRRRRGQLRWRPAGRKDDEDRGVGGRSQETMPEGVNETPESSEIQDVGQEAALTRPREVPREVHWCGVITPHGCCC